MSRNGNYEYDYRSPIFRAFNPNVDRFMDKTQPKREPKPVAKPTAKAKAVEQPSMLDALFGG